MKELRSQAVRALAPENDPLKIGMGWTVGDLGKPQIDSHPGSAHLDRFVAQATRAVNEHGGKAARYFATDMCDGIAQGHDGINYSLAHRDAIVNLVEAQANASVYDGGVFIASCDKSVPAMLMSIGRLKEMSAIVVTGGVMEACPIQPEYIVNDPTCAINELLTIAPEYTLREAVKMHIPKGTEEINMQALTEGMKLGASAKWAVTLP